MKMQVLDGLVCIHAIVLPYRNAWALVCAVNQSCRITNCNHKRASFIVLQIKQGGVMSDWDHQ